MGCFERRPLSAIERETSDSGDGSVSKTLIVEEILALESMDLMTEVCKMRVCSPETIRDAKGKERTSNEMTIRALYPAAIVLAQGKNQQVMEMRVGKRQDEND